MFASPYVLAFTNDNTVPGGGKKSKVIASTAFTKYSEWMNLLVVLLTVLLVAN
jgi:hypothetical protein